MKRWIPLLVLALGVSAAWPQGAAGDQAKATPGDSMLMPGDTAPAFSLPGSDGKTHTLADHSGKSAVVLAWFPKAFTGG